MARNFEPMNTMRVRTNREAVIRYGPGVSRVIRLTMANMGASSPDAAIKNESLRQGMPLFFIKIALCNAI